MYRDDRMQFSIRDTRAVGRAPHYLSKATFRSVATFTAGHTLLRKSLMGNSFWLFKYTEATTSEVGLLLNFGPLPDLTQFFIYFSTSRCQHTCEWQVQHGYMYLSRIQALDDGEEAKARHAGREYKSVEREEAERVFNGPCRQILYNSPVHTFIKIKDPDKDYFFFLGTSAIDLCILY